MTVDLITIVLCFAILVLMSIVIPLVLKWASKKWDLSEVFLSTEKIIALINLIVKASSASETSKSIINMITTGAQKAVEYAEQLYLNGSITAEERKQKAIEYVELALKEMNVEVTEERKQLIMSTIEACVFELPSTNDALQLKNEQVVETKTKTKKSTKK